MTKSMAWYKLAALQSGVAVALGLVVYASFTNVGQAHLNAIGLFLVLAALLYFAVPYLAPADAPFVRKVILASLAVRIGLVVMQHLVWPWFYRHVTADAQTYDIQGWQLAQSWRMGVSHFEWPHTFAEVHSWTPVIRPALLYYAFGHSVFAPEAMNIVWSTSAALAVYTIAYRTFGSREARVAAALTALLPSIMLWSTHNLKDPMTTGAIAWSTCGFVMLRARHRPYLAMVLILVSWFLGFMFRPYVGILTIIGQVSAAGLVAVRTGSMLSRGVQIAMVLVLSLASLTYGTRGMGEIYGDQASLKYAEQKREEFYDEAVKEEKAGGRLSSIYSVDLRASSPLHMVLQLPLRVPLFFLEPFPLRPGTLRLMLTYPEQIFLYCTIPLLLMGVRRGWREERSNTLFCLIAIAPVILAYAMGTSLSGEAVRMRAQVLPVLFVFTGAGGAAYLAKKAKMARAQEPVLDVRALR